MKWRQTHLLCFLFCAVIKYQVESTGCPRNWRTFKGLCYTDTSYRMTYDEGQRFCHYLLESSLVEVNDLDENRFVSNMTSHKSWLGFRRCHNQRFFWTDSEPANFTSWGNGQPDNKDTNEQCVSVSGAGDWSDSICLERKAFVCQKINSKCNNVTECYVMKGSLAKWHEARSICRAEGLRLAKISNSKENQAVASLLRGVNHAWIGLEKKNMFCVRNSSKTTFHKWDFHEPNDEGLVENCIAIGIQGMWSDEECNASLAVICKRDVDECLNKEAHGCSENAVCTNTVGSFKCDTCEDGYSRDGDTCSRKNIVAIVFGALFGVSCLVIVLLTLYILRKSRRWAW